MQKSRTSLDDLDWSSSHSRWKESVQVNELLLICGVEGRAYTIRAEPPARLLRNPACKATVSPLGSRWPAGAAVLHSVLDPEECSNLIAALESTLRKRAADWVGATLGTKYLLGTGLAGVGLSVNFEAFRGAGLKPFAVGGAGAALVGGVGLGVALLLANLTPA